MRYKRRPEVPRQARLTQPRCPLAALEGDALGTCPGFQPALIRPEVVRWFRPEPLPTPTADGTTCAHLGHQLSRRGFRSACAHPGGRPEGAAEIAERLRRLGEARVQCERRLRAGTV